MDHLLVIVISLSEATLLQNLLLFTGYFALALLVICVVLLIWL